MGSRPDGPETLPQEMLAGADHAAAARTPEDTVRAPPDTGALVRSAARLGGVAAAYLMLAHAGLELASIHPNATPIWPATGLAVAAVLLWGYRMLPAIFIGALIANATTAGSIFTSAAIATGNTLEALVSAYLIGRWAGGRAAFESPLGVGKFALIGLAPGPVISATVGVSSVALGGFAQWQAFVPIWTTWWLGDVAGALVVTPVIVLWASAGARSLARADVGETCAIYAGAIAVGLIAFSPLIEQTADRGALAFLAAVPLLWAALRRGPRDTATVALLLSASAVWGALYEGGPFARPTLNASFLTLLAFMISVTIPSLALSADTLARRRHEGGLRRAREAADIVVQSRTAELVAANTALERALGAHQRTEAELREQRLHLVEAQRLASFGSWIWDVAANRVTWSETMFEIFGVQPDTFEGTYEGFLACVHPEDRPGVREVIERAFRFGGDFRIEERIVRPDGETRHLQGSGKAITDAGGKTIRLLGVCQDVTARRRDQAALQEAQQSLHQAQKLEALGQLTGGIAHDFNNILTAIANSLELVRAGIEPQQQQRVDRALQAAHNGAVLVQQLLVFARNQPLRARPADVNEIVRATLTLLERTAPENVVVVADLAADLHAAVVDETQLQTAILNLAVNARDAMPDGGTLGIVTANFGPSAIGITVTDTGIGMPPEILERAFEPFFTTKELGKGTGLGLSMVYSAIRQMGGEVAIESTPGKGTTVRLRLPAVDGAAEAENAPVPIVAAASGTPGTLLYVEDETLVRLATVDVLESAGYAVEAVPDAPRALAVLDRHPEIDLMVTDIGLPGINGHELAAEARRRRPGLKVLFLTGYDRDKGMAELDGSTRHLDKPYSHEALFAALDQLARIR